MISSSRASVFQLGCPWGECVAVRMLGMIRHDDARRLTGQIGIEFAFIHMAGPNRAALLSSNMLTLRDKRVAVRVFSPNIDRRGMTLLVTVVETFINVTP